MKLLSLSFYNRSPLLLAPDLLGKVLVRNLNGQIISGRIVEVEAYLGSQDPAAHSFKGETKRTKSLFTEPGNAYLYSIHTQVCVDVVAQISTSVLIRALEPLEGIDKMKELRNLTSLKLLQVNERNLTNGPGKLSKALGITKDLDGTNLKDKSSAIYIIDDGYKLPKSSIVKSKRIGISKAADLDYRFSIKNNPYVSR